MIKYTYKDISTYLVVDEYWIGTHSFIFNQNVINRNLSLFSILFLSQKVLTYGLFMHLLCSVFFFRGEKLQYSLFHYCEEISM